MCCAFCIKPSRPLILVALLLTVLICACSEDGPLAPPTEPPEPTGWLWQNPPPQGNCLYGVSFIDANTGTAVGACGTILRTTDGGETWVSQTSGTSNYLYGVSFTNANTGTVVGSYGTILRTTSGGD
jgi:hypothetical protein